MKDKLVVIQEYKKLIDIYYHYSCIYPRWVLFFKRFIWEGITV